MTQQDPFSPIYPTSKLNKNFLHLMQDKGWSSARNLIRDLSTSFPDPDGNFLEQFQTAGFDARVWELYVWAYLRDSGFTIDRPSPAPDFLVTRFGITIGIEAVTANPSQHVTDPADTTAQDDDTPEGVDAIAIKLGSALYSKLKKRYWELPQLKDIPLVLAIEDFHQEGSLARTSKHLSTYLYAYSHEWDFDDSTGELTFIKPQAVSDHKRGDKVVPSGFFSLPGAEHISAVLFSNSGTITKFNRMGLLAGHSEPAIRMIRIGTCYNHEGNTAMPLVFLYEVGDPSFPEGWGQGLEMFHNPNALLPVRRDIFPDITHHRIVNGLVASQVPEFQPFGSTTIIMELTGDPAGLDSSSHTQNSEISARLQSVLRPMTPAEISALFARFGVRRGSAI